MPDIDACIAILDPPQQTEIQQFLAAQAVVPPNRAIDDWRQERAISSFVTCVRDVLRELGKSGNGSVLQIPMRSRYWQSNAVSILIPPTNYHFPSRFFHLLSVPALKSGCAEGAGR